jgi:hypothetical protein
MEGRGEEDSLDSGRAAPLPGGQVAAPGWAFVAASAPEVAQPLLGVVRGSGRGGGRRGSGGGGPSTAGGCPPAEGPQPKRVLAPGVTQEGVHPHGAVSGVVSGAVRGAGTSGFEIMVPRPASSLGAHGDVTADGGVYVERRPKGDAREYEWARPAIAPRGRDGVSHDGTPLSSSRRADVSGHCGDEDGGVIPPPPLLRDGGGGASVAWHESMDDEGRNDGVLASCTPGDTASRGCVPWGSQVGGDDAVVIGTHGQGALPPPTSPGNAESLTAMLASGFSCLGPRARPPPLGMPPRGPVSLDASPGGGDAPQAALPSPHLLPPSPASFTSSYESLSAEAALRRVAAAGANTTSPTVSTGGGDGSATPGKGGPGSPVFLETATASPLSSNGGGMGMGMARGADDLHGGVLRPHASGGPQPRARTRSPARMTRTSSGGWADASPKSPQAAVAPSATTTATTDREADGAVLKSLLTP